MLRLLACKKGFARSGKAFLLSFLYAKVRIHTFGEAAVFSGFCCVFLHEVRIVFFESFVKSHDIVCRDKINNPRRCHTIDLIRKDMADALLAVWIELLHLFTPIEAFHDFRDVEPRLHVKIREGRLRVIEAARILLFELIHHFLHDPARSEDLVRLLRRDIVEDILFLVSSK